MSTSTLFFILLFFLCNAFLSNLLHEFIDVKCTLGIGSAFGFEHTNKCQHAVISKIEFIKSKPDGSQWLIESLSLSRVCL